MLIVGYCMRILAAGLKDGDTVRALVRDGELSINGCPV